ncbi:MAG TPA: AI-2E family transporter [Pirellulales bacterium]|nr:AI-2E family transporter [Pirellulales bacterium]
MPRLASFITLLVILLAIAALFLRVMSSFLLPLFLAVLLVVMFRPLHQWILGRCRGRERIAAGLTTLAILAIVLLPMFWVLIQAGSEAKSLVGSWNTQTLKQKFTLLREKIGLALPPQEILDELDKVGKLLDQLSGAVDTKAETVHETCDDLDRQVHQLQRDVEELGDLDRTQPAYWVVNRDADAVRSHLRRLDEDIHAFNEPTPGAGEFMAAVARTRVDFDVLRYDLLGNSLKQWLKQQANPGEEQLAALRAQAEEYADSLARGGAQYAGSVLPELLVGVGVLIISLYYFLADGPAMLKTFMRLSPLDDRYEEELLKEFTTVSRAVVVATLLSAVVQGLLAGAGYFFAGLESVALLTMLTMLFALIPFVGGTVVWLPCCLWLFVEGRTMAAVALFLYCLVFVAMSDNVVKPWVLQGQSNLHPLLALLSVLGGVKAMGPIGILVGPMVVAFLQALLKMFQTELFAMGQKPAAEQ